MSCQTIRLPASSTQPNRDESRWAKARSVTAPVNPFSKERSPNSKLRTRTIAWLLAPEGKKMPKDKPRSLCYYSIEYTANPLNNVVNNHSINKSLISGMSNIFSPLKWWTTMHSNSGGTYETAQLSLEIRPFIVSHYALTERNCLYAATWIIKELIS